LEKLSQADFAGSRMVSIDGWILAETEARQCALYFLINQGKV
jgi:hypothetical protein